MGAVTDQLKLLGWTGDGGACRWYRLDEPMRAVAARYGHEFEVTNSPDPDRPLSVVATQRIWEQSTLDIWRAIRADGRLGLVYDMDDDLWNVEPSNPAFFYFDNPDLQTGLREHMRLAHIVTASTRPLAARLAEELGPTGPPIMVVPNTVPERLLELPRRAPRHGAPVVLGWTGSATHFRDWEDALPHVRRARNRHADLRIHTAGYPPVGLNPDVHLEWTPSLDDHYARLATFDIGLVPLAPGVFNESKSHIKALEMLAVGVPVIASDEPAYRDLIDHGVNGYLVKRPHEWTTYISALTNNPDLRAHMSEQARKTASQFTSENYASVWENIYRLAGEATHADKR